MLHIASTNSAGLMRVPSATLMDPGMLVQLSHQQWGSALCAETRKSQLHAKVFACLLEYVEANWLTKFSKVSTLTLHF